jgi:hypothetical protein
MLVLYYAMLAHLPSKLLAVGVLTATSTVDPDKHFNFEVIPCQVDVPIEVKNEKGEIVSDATVRGALLLEDSFHKLRFLIFWCCSDPTMGNSKDPN